jgi:V8-like Glu-specific endopeptidase
VEWNNLLTQLNYYLAKLYILDTKSKLKVALFERAQFQTIGIDWGETPMVIWYQMLKYAAERDQVDKLLEVLLVPEEGNADNEFLKGALKNIREHKDVIDKKMPDDEWKGGEIKVETREKILGKKSTLLPIGFLENGTDKSKAIVRIDCGNMVGSGFVIENGWLVTNNHVLPNREVAAEAVIQFGYQFPKTLKSSEKSVTEIKPERVASLDPGTENEKRFFTDAKLDFTLVKIKEQDIQELKDYGFLQLSKNGVQPNDFVNIIQHPLGGPKQIGIYNNLVMYADDDIVQYMTDTAEGSSGSPVLNSDWEVVALHHSGGWVDDRTTNQKVRRNQGTNIKRISDFILANKLNGE